MSDTFQLFVYGTLQTGGRAAHVLSGCELLGTGQVGGILYDIDGEFPALVVYGNAPVPGEVWRCPSEWLSKLDEYEDTASGL
ncbi:MAG: gamma-glutamylcyclotransferase family protein, partial [Gemmatimonadota bacterium]